MTGFVPVAAAAGAVGGLADSRIFHWLTRGRLWIVLLGALLVGIVGLNVLALSFSSSSSEAGQAADSLRRQNSAFRAQIAGRLSSSEIQEVAARLGMSMPGPGAFTFLQASAGDAERAAQRLRDGELTAGVAEVAAPVEPVPVETAAVAPVDEAAVAPVEPEAAAVPPETAAPVETAAPPATEAAVAPVADAGSSAGAVGAP